MTGCVRERNGRWQMIFKQKDESGKWRSKEESTGLPVKGNKRKAEKMRDARLAELNRENNRSIEFENKLFLEEMKKWLDTIMVHEVKKPTLDQYQYAFSGRIAKFAPFKKLKMKDLTSALLLCVTSRVRHV